MDTCSYGDGSTSYGQGGYVDSTCTNTASAGGNEPGLAATGLQYFGISSLIIGVTIITITLVAQIRRKYSLKTNSNTA